MKVLWPYNFTPGVKNSGNFMHILVAFRMMLIVLEA